MKINGVEIEDTFAVAFAIKVGRVLITAVTERWALSSAREATGFGTSVIGCPAEAGIECVVSGDETPDGRPGAYILVCNMSFKTLEPSLLFRIGQCVLTAPTTAVFNGLTEAEQQFDSGKKLSFFGDGYQKQEELYGRNMWKIPIISGDFLMEQNIGAINGVAGGNFYIMGQNQMAALTAAEAAVDAIAKQKGTTTPFPGGIVASGSKVGSKYKFLKASTNAAFCSSLREDGVCTMTEDVSAIYEIVINGISQEAVAKSMKAGIMAACQVPGVLRISAANFGGKLGPYQFKLQEILK